MKIESYESYILAVPEADEKESSLGLKALKIADTGKVIKPVTILYNGENRTIFPSDGLVYTAGSKEMSSEDNKKLILSALSEVLSIVDSSEFLERCFIVLNKDYIFYSADERCVKFIVVPFGVKEARDITERNSIWMRECISFVEELLGDKGKITPENLFSYFESMESSQSEELAPTKPEETGELVLRYSGSYGHFSLYVTGNEFRIGNDSNLDGAITFNTSISREHCVILRQPDGYYLQDTNSTNGSFINEDRVLFDTPRRIAKGDVIRLADMNFNVDIK